MRRRSFPGRGLRGLLIVALAAACFAAGSFWALHTRAGEEASSAPGREETSSAAQAEESTVQSAEESSSPSARGNGFQLEVPFLSQTENWPTGCESVSAVMALNYAGLEVSIDDFIENYLPLGNPPYEGGRRRREGHFFGSDPREYFLGDPASDLGWGCYAPVILQAVEELLADRGSDLEVLDLEGYTLDELCGKWVSQGTPVLVWATIDMEEPQDDITFTIEGTGEEFTWVYPLHCLLLTGWDEENYYFNDPLRGENVSYNRWACQVAYGYLGRQALAVA